MTFCIISTCAVQCMTFTPNSVFALWFWLFIEYFLHLWTWIMSLLVTATLRLMLYKMRQWERWTWRDVPVLWHKSKNRSGSKQHVWAIHAQPVQWEAQQGEGQVWACCWLWLNALPEGSSLCCVCVVGLLCAHKRRRCIQSFNTAEGNSGISSKSTLSFTCLLLCVCGFPSCVCRDVQISDLTLVVLPSAKICWVVVFGKF